MSVRRTKIICTLGPATDADGVPEAMARAGMDVARMNFSHGTFSDHKRRIDRIKAIRQDTGLPIGIMLDTKGPEIRIGHFATGSVELRQGERFTLCAYELEGDGGRVSVSYPVQNVVKEGVSVLIDDGLIELCVEKICGRETVCRVVTGGDLKSGKSINIPGITIEMPYITHRDKMDIEFGVQQGVDFIAASFVRSAEDVKSLRRLLKECGGEHIEIISKIENRSGVERIGEIIEASDGIMIARGDLGVEIEMEKLPAIQKRITKMCLERGKKCVTATQMLESMIKNARPTRAEVTDVANAILDGTGAVMLSGETAAGDYPVQSVAVMNKIAETTERELTEVSFHGTGVTEAIAGSASKAAREIGADAILTVTHSGHTANMVSKYRPPCVIAAVTRDRARYYQMSLSWGVKPYLDRSAGGRETRFEKALEIAKKEGYTGTLVVTGGDEAGMTNILKILQT